MKLHKVLFCLIVVAIALNLDRLILGEAASVRLIDVADILIAKFQHGGEFWRHPFDNAWNASIMRGWPAYLETVHPQHLCSLLSAFLPASLSYTIFQIILDAFILTGTYMFCFNFLGFRHLTALYGSLISLSLFYWFNENPFVILVPLLPLVVALTTHGKHPIDWRIRISFLMLALLLMYPPYTVPMLPLMHGIVVFFLSDKNTRFKNISFSMMFWGVFAVLYLPNLLAFASQWAHSNRVLWEALPPVFSFKSLMGYLKHAQIIVPCLCIIILFNFWKNIKALILLALIVSIAVIVSQSTLLSGIPFLSKFSFAWGRGYYFINFLWMLLAVYLIERVPLDNRPLKIMIGVVKIVVCAVLSASLLWPDRPLIDGKYLIFLGIFSSLCILFDFLKYATNGIKLVLLALIFLAPFKIFYYISETAPYGYLHLDPFTYDHHVVPSRVVTVSDNCFPLRFFSAQASIKNQETFDGVSVFYNGNDAANWIKYVLTDKDPCSFRSWNNRMELTYEMGSPNVIKWLKFNNVEFIRSQTPLHLDDFIPVDEKQVKYSEEFSILHKKVLTKTWYQYRLKNTSSRVMSIPRAALKYIQQQTNPDQVLFDALNDVPLKNVMLSSYVPSRLKWEGNFEGQEILISSNYHKDWRLYIDHQEIGQSVKEGPFGMLQVSPMQGWHQYELRFSDNMLFLMIFFSILGFALLFVFVLRSF